MFIETMLKSAADNLFGVFNPDSRIYYLYLATSALLALVAYVVVERSHAAEEAAERGEEPPPGFLAWLFTKRVWMHRSAFQDYKIFVVNGLVYYGLIAQAMISTPAIINGLHGSLTRTFGELDAPVLASGWSIAAYTAVSVLAFDFAVFLAHWTMHKVPTLWHFHKVHHSAEVLNPMTLFRMHPVDLFITSFLATLFGGLGLGGLFYLTQQTPQEYSILGLNVVIFAFYMLGYNLRHSQVWLSYPAWLSHILVSPAQHQIHHSSDRRHFDSNMGLIFAFWDWMFGTLYVPKQREKLTYGIDGPKANPFDSVWDFYFKPFVWAGRSVARALPEGGRRRLFYAGLALLVVGYGATFAVQKGVAGTAKMAKVNLEAMTWIEVNEALARGFDTVIVPTGGTEQNGPFVTLGKHNAIVAHTAQEIAQHLGKTLVAPVLGYVPEGDPDVAENHMAYSGTISLPEPAFEALLEATARSLKTHGFRTILLIGDSGGNQEPQARVAERLSAAWKSEGVIVAHLGDYYAVEKQAQWLRTKGFSDAQIGKHAGMRDTSELMAVKPEWVRIAPFTLPLGHDAGAHGDPSRATVEIGLHLLAMKVDLAVTQARALLEAARAAEKVATR